MGAFKCRASCLVFFAFFYLNPAFSLAQTPPSESEEVTDASENSHLSDAADSLYSILQQGKQSGFIKSKTGESLRDPNGKGDGKTTSSVSSSEAENSMDSANCDVADIFDFASFTSITGYEDIAAAKIASNRMGGEVSALYMARVYLSLGLGDEAANLLKTYTTPQAVLLKDIANILKSPQDIRKDNGLAAYADCSAHAFLWSALENPENLETQISGQKRRVLLRTLRSYPDQLADILSVSVAIRMAENDQMILSEAIWGQMENDARELKKPIPEDKTDRHDILYLNALLSERTDPEYTRALLMYLGEREGVYQMAALKKLSDMNRLEGQPASKAVETDLMELSQKSVGSETGQSAAFELVRNRLHQGDARQAIVVTRKYFSESDPEYYNSAVKIRSLIEGRLNSETLLDRIIGLNDYLDDMQFFLITGDITSLKYSALKAAMASGLPELHSKIFENTSATAPETLKLIKEAEFFNALKSSEGVDINKKVAELDLSETGLKRIVQFALARNDIPLAKTALSKLPASDKKEEFSTALAWAEGRWADTAPVKVADSDKGITASKFFTTAVIEPITTNERAWMQMIPQNLIDVDTAVRDAKAFLKNG